MILLLIVVLLACSKAQVGVQMIPEIWKDKVERGDALYSKDQSGGLMPEVGNGYLATVVGSDTIYVAGMFSGDSRGIYGDVSHRARIPSYHVFPTANRSQGYGRVLDMQNACFEILTALPNVTLFERWYAPFQEKHLLVHEMHFTSLIDNDSVTIELTLQETKESDDLNVTRVDDGIMNGTQRIPETRDNYTIISYVVSMALKFIFHIHNSNTFTTRTHSQLEHVHTDMQDRDRYPQH